MSYLRTNYRLTGKELDITAIGGGIVEGSWGGGPGTDRAHGGFIMGSVNVQNSIYQQSAYGAMSAYFGSGIFDSGYKIWPVNVVIKAGSVPLEVFPTGSITSVFALIPRLRYEIGSAGSIAWTYSIGDSYSMNLIWAGFIVSGP
jgi:hypothetical protein